MIKPATEIDPEEEVTEKKRLYFAIAAGIATAVFSTMVISVGEGVLSHASADELKITKEECLHRAEMIKAEADAKIAKLEAESRKADLEEKRARIELQKILTEHMRQNTADTMAAKKDLEWIRRGVDRLMKAEMKKGNID